MSPKSKETKGPWKRVPPIKFLYEEADELSEEELKEIATLIAKWILNHKRKQSENLKAVA